MKGLYRSVAIFASGMCVFSAGVLADQVVLKSGPRITGEVTVKSDTVRIENELGILTLPLWRVAGISFGSEDPTWPAEARSAAGNEPKTVEIPQSIEPAETPGPLASADELSRVPSPREVLASRIDVSFDETPLVDAMVYLQEATGGNFAYVALDLEAAPAPVRFTLKGVTVRQILDILLEGRDLGWSVRGNTILVGKGATAQGMSLRVYDVRDLVVNTQDRIGGGVPTAAAATTGAYGYGGGYSGGYGGGYGLGIVAESETVSERVRSLAELVTETVRPESWQEPAVVATGEAEVTSQAVKATAESVP